MKLTEDDNFHAVAELIQQLQEERRALQRQVEVTAIAVYELIEHNKKVYNQPGTRPLADKAGVSDPTIYRLIEQGRKLTGG